MKDREDQASVTHFLNIIYKRRWGALTVFAVILALVMILTFKAQPIYRSVAKVAISQRERKLVDSGDKRLVREPMTELLSTQSEILRGRTFTEAVIERIDAETKDEKLKKLFDEEYPPPKRTDRMMRRVNVDASTKSSVLTISAESRHPKVAALIASQYVEMYKEYSRKDREAQFTESLDGLKRKIEEQRKDVDEATKALSDYKAEKGIYPLSREDEDSLEKAKLRLYLEKLHIAEAEVNDVEMPYNRHKKDYETFKSMKDAENDDFLKLLPKEIAQSDAKAEYDAIRMKLENLRQTRGGKHPKVRAAVEELSLKRGALAKAYDQFMYNLEKDYMLAAEKRDYYLNKVKSFERQDETTAEFIRLQTKLDTARRIYNTFQDEYMNLGALRGIDEGIFISVIDKPYVPDRPAKPSKLLNIILGFLAAGIFGLGTAFLQEHLDSSIKSQEDIEEFLELPLLGSIPLMKYSNNSGTRKEIVVVSDPKSLAAEAFKTVRTGLFFASRNSDLRTMLVTSGAPSEGKTIFAMNLALTIAQSGSKTLLIDADIRKPRVHRILHLDNAEGLTSYLSSVGGVIRTQRCAQDKNLYVVTSGPVKSNPTELLGSPRMKNLIEEARKKFDKIIIDTPPVMTVSDPLILTGISDGVVQVINFGKSNKRVQLRTKHKINSFGGRIVGAVLNRVDFEKDGSSFYYQNYYYSSSS